EIEGGIGKRQRVVHGADAKIEIAGFAEAPVRLLDQGWFPIEPGYASLGADRLQIEAKMVAVAAAQIEDRARRPCREESLDPFRDIEIGKQLMGTDAIVQPLLLLPIAQIRHESLLQIALQRTRSRAR